MSFSERVKDERRPLIREPVWSYSHRYDRTHGQASESDIDDLLGIENPRNQRFQWMMFLGVTFLSILILMATMGVLIKLSGTHPPPTPKVNPVTTPHPLPKNVSSTTTSTLTTTPGMTTLTSSTLPPSDAQQLENRNGSGSQAIT